MLVVYYLLFIVDWAWTQQWEVVSASALDQRVRTYACRRQACRSSTRIFIYFYQSSAAYGVRIVQIFLFHATHAAFLTALISDKVEYEIVLVITMRLGISIHFSIRFLFLLIKMINE